MSQQGTLIPLELIAAFLQRQPQWMHHVAVGDQPPGAVPPPEAEPGPWYRDVIYAEVSHIADPQEDAPAVRLSLPAWAALLVFAEETSALDAEQIASIQRWLHTLEEG